MPFVVWVGLSVIYLYAADDVRESSSRPKDLVMSFFHNHELRALKSPVRTEQIGNSSFMSLRHVSNLETLKFIMILAWKR